MNWFYYLFVKIKKKVLTLYIEFFAKKNHFHPSIKKSSFKKMILFNWRMNELFYSFFFLIFLTLYRTFIHDTSVSVRMYWIVDEGKGGNFGNGWCLCNFGKGRRWSVGCMCSYWRIDDNSVSCSHILGCSACRNVLFESISHAWWILLFRFQRLSFPARTRFHTNVQTPA